MKKLLYVAIALFAVSCSAENDLQDTLYNVAEAGANMALDSLHQAVDKEIELQTGVDSLASKIRAVDTLDVEREVKKEVIRRLLE